MAEVEMAMPDEAPQTSGAPSPDEHGAGQKSLEQEEIRISCRGLQVYYGDMHAITNVDLDLPKNRVTAFIGPSGCGKSTVLRCLNRMNDLVPSCRVEGTILLDGNDIYAPETDVVVLRRKVGMVFQKSNPFPKSIFENVAYGLRLAGINDKAELSDRVEDALKGSGLWSEVSDRLNDNALGLSGGQQQRLCIARALAVEPEVILMDEPCSALDPIATARIEALLHELREDYTVVIVTHNMQQAARVSDYTAFFYLGELVELGPTQELFTRPREQKTEDYVTGRFG